MRDYENNRQIDRSGKKRKIDKYTPDIQHEKNDEQLNTEYRRRKVHTETDDRKLYHREDGRKFYHREDDRKQYHREYVDKIKRKLDGREYLEEGRGYLDKIKSSFENLANEVSISDYDEEKTIDLLGKNRDVIELRQIPNFDLNKNLRKTRRRYFLKALITIVLFTVIYIIIGRFLFSYFYGEYRGPFYFSEDYLLTFGIIIYVLVLLLIIRRAIYSAFSYIREVVNAMEKVYDDSNKAIVLNSDLREVEYRLNTIKMELKESKNAAIDAEKRKNDLIMYLAHDLKTPLTSIIGFLGILRDEKLLPDSFKQKYTEICYDKATRLEDLINEFFEITRFGINKIELEKSRVDMSMMMEQFVSEFEPIARQNSLKLTSNIEKGVSLYVDVGKMERVFDNLLRNAISYSYDNSNISVSMFTRGGEFFFEVCNSGKTIPPEKLERLFEEFFRVDSARSTKTGNAGLGLTISKSIVEAHGGKIIATSEDEITKMSVRLPIK